MSSAHGSRSSTGCAAAVSSPRGIHLCARTRRIVKVILPSSSLFANFYDPERSRPHLPNPTDAQWWKARRPLCERPHRRLVITVHG